LAYLFVSGGVTWVDIAPNPGRRTAENVDRFAYRKTGRMEDVFWHSPGVGDFTVFEVDTAVSFGIGAALTALQGDLVSNPCR
jgi:hypothetical protein